jgi:ubiquinone/menaquinone biosynthesis C-methylase UbiE
VALAVGLALLPGCTAWKQCAYESGDRGEWQQVDAVIEALDLPDGARVADLGAGSGYFTRPLARAVAPDGKVWAVDVDAEMLEHLRERLDEEGIENVEIVLGEYTDPKLPDGGIDLVFSSNTFHHIQDRPAYFRDLKRDLAPGGRVALIDYDGSKGLFVKIVGHYVERDEVLGAMEQAGYRLDADHTFLDRQSFLVFAPE